jgi:hypothetical protein
MGFGLYWIGMDAKHSYPYLKSVKEKGQTYIHTKLILKSKNYKQLFKKSFFSIPDLAL